jgi:hypothetical protein
MAENQNPKIRTDAVYWKAFLQAYQELESLKKQEKEIAVRKAQLHESIKALARLVSDTPVDINSLTLADAIRLVVRSSQRPLGVPDVRTKLVDLGYDIDKYENVLASIHTAMERMVDTHELVHIQEESKKKRFEAGPELKPVPEVEVRPLKELLEIRKADEKKGEE